MQCTDIGIDLGTASILVYIRGKGNFSGESEKIYYSIKKASSDGIFDVIGCEVVEDLKEHGISISSSIDSNLYSVKYGLKDGVDGAGVLTPTTLSFLTTPVTAPVFCVLKIMPLLFFPL